MDIEKILKIIPKWLISFALVFLIFFLIFLYNKNVTFIYGNGQLGFQKVPKNLAIITTDVSNGAIIPIGAIIPWHKNLFGVTPLPDGWVECNGKPIEDKKSPLYGQDSPPLNSQRLFLRGAKVSGKEQSQDWKSFYVAGFDRGGDKYTHSDVHIPKTGYNNVYPYGGSWGVGEANNLRFKFDDSEVRPKNMSVVWIMKIK